MKPQRLAPTSSVFAALMVFIGAAGAAESVGFNFMDPADNSVLGAFPLSEKLAPDDIAGVVPQTNWNNLTQGGGPYTFRAADGIRIYWDALGGGTHNLRYGETPGDSLLMRGYLDTGNTSTDTVIVSGLQFPLYDVICYSKGENGYSTRVGKFTLSATNNGVLFTNVSKYIQDDGGSVFDGTFIEANSTSGWPNAASGNYCRFYNVRGTNFAVRSTPNYGSDVGRSPFNALQIVPIDATPVLSNPSYANGQFQCFLNGATNASYTILASANLVDWLPVSTNTAPARITVSAPAKQTFYRALFQ
jgi:hypothetical protein